MQLTISQKRMVNKLFKAFLERKKYKFSSFKAPTGSGKTFMASEFISRVFANEMSSKSKSIFVVATISNAKLPKQFAKKLNDYKRYHEFNNYKIKHIESPSALQNYKVEDIPEFILEDNKVFVFGISSFGKKTLFFQNKVLDTFIQQAKLFKYQIFFIRDEAHIGKKETISKKDLESFDEKMKKISSFIVEMTATPKNKRNLIEMTTNDMMEDGQFLLKTKMEKTKLIDEVSNEEIIDDAILAFLNSKKEYQKLNKVIINPAMLIQVMNESNYEKDPIKNAQFHNGLKLLEKKLHQNGLKYLKYLKIPEVIGTNVPNTLEYAAKLDSEIDVIIFKVGPATGWDIPRANMLLQLRNVSSEVLNLQTLGRIMRNPYPGLKQNKFTDKYYVWSNYQKPTREEAFYKIKEKFINETFFAGKIDVKNKEIIQNNEKYRMEVLQFLNSKEFINKIKDLNINKDIVYDVTNYGNAKVPNKIPNHVYLKIYNIKIQREYENLLQISLFYDELRKISKQLKKSIEIIKYCLFQSIFKLKEIKNKNSKWINNHAPYKLLDDAPPLKHYFVWKDNENPKCVKTSYFENYGYYQIDQIKDIQYFDSMPEKEFYQKFKDIISSDQKKNINFFAKMPSLGSKVYFEYYSKSHGKISKSYMDFAIKYKNKIIMIEVKSKDEDYDKQKTQELVNAYKMYMNKFHKKNISLVLYEYHKEASEHFLSGYFDKKWQENIGFRDLFDNLLDN